MTPARRTALALLALPVLALSACGGGSDDSSGGGGGAAAGAGSSSVAASGAPDAQTAAVAGTTSLTFEPSTVTAKPGALALTLQIQGGVPHNLVFDDESVGAGIPVTSSGSATGRFTFPKAGTYDFVCTLHENMNGKVVVS